MLLIAFVTPLRSIGFRCAFADVPQNILLVKIKVVLLRHIRCVLIYDGLSTSRTSLSRASLYLRENFILVPLQLFCSYLGHLLEGSVTEVSYSRIFLIRTPKEFRM